MTIDELEEWYRTAPSPEMPVYLDAATKVTDYAQFVNSHFEGIRHAKVDLVRNPLIWRLEKMKLLIEANI
ncbi:hypothetical protein D3C87_719930 [compost metagenome]